jgi:hypothetical protein
MIAAIAQTGFILTSVAVASIVVSRQQKKTNSSFAATPITQVMRPKLNVGLSAG